jgi:hypothetical protein
MIPALLAIPVLGFFALIQTVIVSRIPLIYGTADIVLLAVTAWALNERVKHAWLWTIVGGLLVSLLSALPFLLPLWAYLIVTAIARLLRKRVWQTPILCMLLMSFVGTLIMHSMSIAALYFQGTRLPLSDTLNLVTLPSALLNLFLSVPVYAVINDLANGLFPEENQV